MKRAADSEHPSILSAALSRALERPRYTATPGLLSKLSGVPRATIINWLEGRVAKPRHWQDLIRVADALRLSEIETTTLLEAAGHPAVRLLFAQARGDEDVQLLELWQRINGDPRESGAPVTRTGLPAQLAGLIGREREVEELRDRLAAPVPRLLTLVGTGGVGKTHLGVAAAHEAAGVFPDGVVWVPLAGVTEPEQVLFKIAQALGLQETDPKLLPSALTSALHTERMLLVIDNFEQLMPAAAQLHDLLETTLHLKLLVTSRAALRLRGEVQFRVIPLAVPDVHRLPPPRVLQGFGAVALFVARAQALQSDFMLDDTNAAAVAAICAHLEGLPLALELAAARTKLLSAQALLPRLQHRLSFLVNGTRDTDPRHHTLRKTIDWSYALLSQREQKLFRQLAVFVGGISLGAAAHVSRETETPGSAMSSGLFEALTTLVDQSLLSAAPGSTVDNEPRFSMLETIREYALELLSEHEETERAKELHAEYFVHFSEGTEAVFASQPTMLWLERFKLEHENLRAALQWSIADGKAAGLGARLVAALGRYWFERGFFREGRFWLEQTLVTAAGLLPESTDAQIRLYLAFAANYESDYRAGEASAREALDAYERAGDAAGAAQARNALGIAAMYTGRYGEAESFFGEALATYRRLDDRRGIAVALHNLGEIAAEGYSNFETAKVRYTESLEIFRQLEHNTNVACTLGVLGEMASHLGEIEDAVKFSREALAIHLSLGNGPLIAEESARIGRCELLLGNLEEAQRALQQALQYLEASFNARHVARCFDAFAQLALAAGVPESGAQFLGFSENLRARYLVPRSPAYDRAHARLLGDLRNSMPADAFAAEWRRGQTLDAEQAFVEARSLTDPRFRTIPTDTKLRADSVADSA